MNERELLISRKLKDYKEKGIDLLLPTGFVPKLPLYKHQVTTFYYATSLANCAILNDLGTGKTACAINAVRWRLERGQINRALVVCPRNVLPNWAEEVDKHSDLNVITLHDAIRNKRIQKFGEEAEIYLINYDAIALFYEFLDTMNFDLLILDEATRIKNIRAKRSKSLLKLSESIPFKITMTGTPITGKPEEVFNIIRILDKDILGNNFYQFRYNYFTDVGIVYPKWIPKKGTLEKLSNKIYQIGVRYTKAECTDLPEKVYQNYHIVFTKEQDRYYREICDKIEPIINNTTVSIKAKVVELMKLAQVEDGFLKEDDKWAIGKDGIKRRTAIGISHPIGTKNPKLEALSDLLDDLLYDNKKVVIWSRFRWSIKACETLCKNKGIGVLTYYGDTKEKDKNVAVKLFQTDPKYKVMVGHPRAGGIGVNLTEADTVIYYSLTEGLEEYLQSQDRTHRIGSEKHDKITYIHLLAKGKIGEKILQALKANKSLADLIVDGVKII